MAEGAAELQRRAVDPRLKELTERFAVLDRKHDQLAREVRTNTELTKEIHESTSGLVDAWQALSGGLKVLDFLGKVAKWCGVVLGAFVAGYGLWHAVRTGTPVEIPQ